MHSVDRMCAHFLAQPAGSTHSCCLAVVIHLYRTVACLFFFGARADRQTITELVAAL